MAIHPLIAAKTVCELCDWSASNLEINKLLYIAHMMSLGRSDGQSPLVTEHFEAWDYGPVLPTVYHRAKAFGSSPVQNVFHIFPSAHGAEKDLIREAVESLADKTPGELVAITHWDHGAWAKYYRPGERGLVIPNRAIFDEYKARVG